MKNACDYGKIGGCNWVMLTVYEYEQKRSRVIAVAYDEGGLLVDEVFPLSNAAWATIGA